MKRKNIILFAMLMLFVFAFPMYDFASPKVIATYEKSNKKVIFTNGRDAFYLKTYSVSLDEGTYICVEDLEALGFEKKWIESSRETFFTVIENRLESPIKRLILRKNANFLKENSSIYESDVKVFVDGVEIKTYNANGYSLVDVSTLSSSGVDFFFTVDEKKEASSKLYPIRTPLGFGLVDMDGVIVLKPQYSSIDFFQTVDDRFLVDKRGAYSIIDSKGNTIVSLESSEMSYSYIVGDFVLFSPDSGNRVLFDTDGKMVFGDEKYVDYKFIRSDYRESDKDYIIGIYIDGRQDIFEPTSQGVKLIASLPRSEFDYANIVSIANGVVFERVDWNKPLVAYDLQGKRIAMGDYFEILPFKGDYAVCRLAEDRYSFIDKNFDRVTDIDYSEVSFAHDGNFLFRKDGDYSGRSSDEGVKGATFGLASLKYGTLIQPDYLKLNVYDDLIRFSKYGDKYGIMNYDSSVVLEEKFDLIQVVDGSIHALLGDTLYIYSKSGDLISSTKVFDRNSLLDNTKYFVKFAFESIEYDYPRDLPTHVWDDYRGDTKISGDLIRFYEGTFKDEESSRGFSMIKYLVNSKGVSIPYALRSMGMVAPPSDDYFPNYLSK